MAGKPGASGGLAAPINARAPGTIVLSLSRNHMSAEAPMQAASLSLLQTRHGERGAIPALERRCWPMPDALVHPQLVVVGIQLDTQREPLVRTPTIGIVSPKSIVYVSLWHVES